MTTTLFTLDAAAADHARAHAALAACASEISDLIAAVKRANRRRLMALAASAAATEQTLRNHIAAAPHLFVRPRTLILHGLKLGYAKDPGGLDWDDPERVLELIRRHLPDQAAALIRVKETPNKETLETLSAADLKRLGVRIVAPGDRIVCQPVEAGIDKLVTLLVREAAAAGE
jgi:hypothetical protein